jgi:hypothetical protein
MVPRRKSSLGNPIIAIYGNRVVFLICVNLRNLWTNISFVLRRVLHHDDEFQDSTNP